jgi:hypothetical protein
MQLSIAVRTGVRIQVALLACVCLYAQEHPAPDQQVRPKESLGVAPRAAPSDYQAQGKAGAVTIGAEFVRHSVPTPEGTLSTEDFVVVEVGLYGPPGARIQISLDDFSLRLNGKKTPLRGEPFGLVLASLKDPEWQPPEAAAPKSKTSLGGGGGDQQDPGSPPPVVHVPLEASLPLGDRALPQAGLLFFSYRGRVEKIESVELIYRGSAGKATLALRP